MLQCIISNADNLKYASSDLKNDKEFILNILKNNGAFILSGGEECDGEPIDYTNVIILNNISKNLRNDTEIVVEAVKADCGNIKFIPDELKNNREFILKMVNDIKSDWRTERNIRHIFCTEEKPSLAYLSEKFQDDEEIVLAMVKKDEDNLKYVSNRLKNDNNFVLKVLSLDCGYFFKERAEYYLAEILKNNKDKNILLSRNHISFFELTEKQRTDKELALKVLSNNGYQLKYYTSEKIKSDKNIVLNAIMSRSFAFKWASNKLKNDKDIALIAMKERGRNLKYASPRLKDDFDVVITAVKNDYNAIKYASNRLKNNKEILQEIESKKNFEKARELYWKEYNTNKIEIPENNLWTDKINSDKSNDLER